MDAPPIRYCRAADGIEIGFVSFGQGPTVVLAEGAALAGLDLSTHSEAWMQRFAALAEERTVVLFDWGGLGASVAHADGFSPAGFGADLSAVMDAVGPEPVDLVGFLSLGHVALGYAARHPSRVRRFAWVNPQPPGHSGRTSPGLGELYSVAQRDWSLFSEVFSLLSFGWTDIALARLQRERLLTRFNAELRTDLMSAIEALDELRGATALTMPALMLLDQEWPNERRGSVPRRLYWAGRSA